MLWMELTSERFGDAVKESGGLCLLPIGCLERHGPHLPLGTDQIAVDEVARLAAEEEPAVVFPSYYFGQISEARHCPGTFSLPHDLLLRLLKTVTEEIHRNGFSKILIVNGHGGNSGLLGFLMSWLRQEPREYLTYAVMPWQLEEEDRERAAEMADTQGGHAGEMETSTILALRPELVHLEDIKDPNDGRRREGQKALGRVSNPFGWYANFPTHYGGDARPASAEKGQFMMEAQVRRLVNAMRAVKADEATPKMQREFYAKADGTK